jgi:hypothetical protein
VKQHTRQDGLLIAVAGATRWGKSHWLKKQIAAASRVLVRDPRGEYLAEGFTPARNAAELAALLSDIGPGEGKISFWASDSEFTAFCEMAYAWGMLWPAVIVVEETASVVPPGKAPKEWGDLVRMGLYYGNHIYAVTQRPQEADKTTWHNASMMHFHGFTHPAAQQAAADILGVPLEMVASLPKYDYLERWQGEKEVIQGRADP